MYAGKGVPAELRQMDGLVETGDLNYISYGRFIIGNRAFDIEDVDNVVVNAWSLIVNLVGAQRDRCKNPTWPIERKEVTND